MQRPTRLICAALMLTVSGLAFSQDEGPRWGYIEAGYIDFEPEEVDSDDGGFDGSSEDGAFAGGSMKIFKMFHIVAEYSDVGDFNFWNAGFGWHGLLGPKADLYGTAVWNDYDEDDGVSFDAGVRWNVLKWLEVNGQGRWIDLDVGGSDVLFRVGGMALILKGRLGFGANWETGDSDTVRAFARFNFGG